MDCLLGVAVGWGKVIQRSSVGLVSAVFVDELLAVGGLIGFGGCRVV